ncbi:unnamed protein product [Blumeria hordei]|uniref:Bola-like protein n=2 Tax=Blumeria hordei TaxID=2867405 RepID=A0A383UJ70_BLUHO|nr:putative protein/bolA like protein [Blumeria hordei DH14]SZE99829.1 unnamed protein product [Blumeria hordei]
MIGALRPKLLPRRRIAGGVLTTRLGAGLSRAKYLSSNRVPSGSPYSRTPGLPPSPSFQRPFSGHPAKQDQNTGERESTTAELAPPENLNAAEKEIYELLARELEPSVLKVQDISGGCGSMYEIHVVSARFRGLRMLQQQRLVNGVLGDMIKKWHGMRLTTSDT